MGFVVFVAIVLMVVGLFFVVAVESIREEEAFKSWGTCEACGYRAYCPHADTFFMPKVCPECGAYKRWRLEIGRYKGGSFELSQPHNDPIPPQNQ